MVANEPMQIVPVIDLKGGLVVHARRGDRNAYAPLSSPLARTADPVDVVRGLCRLFSFTSLYVADLDAIAGIGDHDDMLTALADAFPALEFWVDAGVSGLDAAADILAHPARHIVIGSESQTSDELLLELAANPRVILSLDFRGDDFLGHKDILDEPTLWPGRVLVMTLSRVGSEQGPDLERIHAIAALAQGRAVFAAGGVRNSEDLIALKDAGCAGALVATALHSGAIDPRIIDSIAT